MLFLHELHRVRGVHEQEFEAAFRDGWRAALGAGDGARLLWFLHHAHGTGPSYRVVTITVLRDAAAFGALAERVQRGDLADWARHVDGLRHDVHAKLLEPLPWSPLQSLDLARVPVDGPEREPALYMEDTVWPYPGQLEAYIEAAGSHYAKELAEARGEARGFLRIEASFRTAFGSERRREVVLWQRVIEPRALRPLITREVPEQYKAPGTWMHDALAYRDQWESRLLRTAPWSPLPDV